MHEIILLVGLQIGWFSKREAAQNAQSEDKNLVSDLILRRSGLQIKPAGLYWLKL